MPGLIALGRGDLVADREIDAVACRRRARTASAPVSVSLPPNSAWRAAERQQARRRGPCRRCRGRDANWPPTKIVPVSRRYSSRASPAVRVPALSSCCWCQAVPVSVSRSVSAQRPSKPELARARLDEVLLADAERDILLAGIGEQVELAAVMLDLGEIGAAVARARRAAGGDLAAQLGGARRRAPCTSTPATVALPAVSSRMHAGADLDLAARRACVATRAAGGELADRPPSTS